MELIEITDFHAPELDVYARLTEAQLLDRTREVAKVMPVIGFYLQTAVGGRHFTYDYWTKIAEIEGVVAIKAAPFNRYYT